MAIWIEKGSRGLAHVAMDDFPTMADALFELADNPLDYRHGRHLEIDIDIDREHDCIAVEDRGGEGMDAEGVADWLNWGSGHRHAVGDIGRYHKGGKAACGYIAESLVVLTRRAGRREVWRFEDRHWKSRTDWTNYGEPAPYDGPIPVPLAGLPIEVGFTRLELTDLVERRYNVEKLRWMIGNTYRRLINKGDVSFRLNGESIAALDLPLSSAFDVREKNIHLPSGRRVHVWVGRLDRDAVKSGPNRIQGGLRLLHQGRLISEGEYFEHNLGGQGQLASLVGEVDLNHLAPLSNKTGFKRDTPDWEEVHFALHEWLAPLIIEFRRAAEEQTVSREEKKRASEVRRQLTEAFREMRSDPAADPARGEQTTLGGRMPPSPSGEPLSREGQGGHHKAPAPRTEAPETAVGVLERLARRLKRGNEAPPIELGDFDPSLRSEAVRVDDTVTKVVINRAYPLYGELKGHEAYLAETALLELLVPAATEKTPVTEYVAQVNQCLHAWWRVARRSDEGPPS